MTRYTIALATPIAFFIMMTVGCSNADSQNHTRSSGAGRADVVEPRAAPPNPADPDPADPKFSAYWYAGKAEVTRYALEQARYGELRSGDAVLVFVTEDFLADRQVKLESAPAGRPVASVLKMNMTKNFVTGIYPYTMMTSVFTPIERDQYPRSLKVATAVQEWCGHTYTQINLKDNAYRFELRSYFEKEGDQMITLNPVMLEDEVWTRIRLSPFSLPTGEIQIIPGTMQQRLRHTAPAVETAVAKLEDAASEKGRGATMRYTLEYAKSQRTLSIEFERAFPHRIMSWSETYTDGFGPKAKQLTTRAVRTNELKVDYWTKNGTGDAGLRRELGLP